MTSASHCVFPPPSFCQSCHLPYLTAATFQADHALLILSCQSSLVFFEFPHCYWLHSLESTSAALTEKPSVWAAVIIVAVVFLPRVQCMTLTIGLLQYMKTKHFPVVSADDFFLSEPHLLVSRCIDLGHNLIFCWSFLWEKRNIFPSFYLT